MNRSIGLIATVRVLLFPPAKSAILPAALSEVLDKTAKHLSKFVTIL